MSDRGTARADWVAPAIIAGVGLVLLLMTVLIIAFTADDGVEDSGLVYELDVYTSCLSNHGANVPVVDAHRDGGFSVTVPGSLVDGDVDTTVWREAYDQCSDVTPDLFGGLLGGLSGGLLRGLMDGFPEGNPYDHLSRREICSRLSIVGVAISDPAPYHSIAEATAEISNIRGSQISPDV